MAESLINYLPEFLQEIREYKALYDDDTGVVQAKANVYDDEINNWEDNLLILTADKTGLAEYEKRLTIPASDQEDTELRRQRLLNRWAFRPPYSSAQLVQRIQSIIPTYDDVVPAVSIDVNYASKTATVTVSNISDTISDELLEQYTKEVNKTVAQLFPVSLTTTVTVRRSA